MNAGVFIWIAYFVIGLTMIILPLVGAIYTTEICGTLIDLQTWLYIQFGTQIGLYIVILPYCFEIYFYNFSNFKFQYPRSIFRMSCILTIIISLFSISWAGVGIYKNYTCPNSLTTGVILASSALNLSIYIIGTIIVLSVLLLDIFGN